METESGAKIAIRGKGSVKEGKGKSDAAHASNQDEDLHCLIMADTEDKVNKAKKLIHNVIETVRTTLPPYLMIVLTHSRQAASIPEGQNELKRNQLRELAALNGTLRDDENQACQNCGEIGHRKYDCPQARNFTANIICRVCGNAGHMARDCPDRVKGGGYREIGQGGLGRDRAIENSMDSDYDKLMKELGGVGGSDGPQRQIGWDQGGAAGENDQAAPARRAPWEQPAGGAAPPWAQNRQPSNQTPWNNQNRGGGGYDGGYNAAPATGAAPPWQQPKVAAPPWAAGGATNGNAGGGYAYSGGQNYGGGQGYGGQAPPWQPQQQYGIPPPPPPGDIPPPPPPPDDVPPPPPPPRT